MRRRRPKVAVIVVGYNSRQWLRPCISSVLSSDGAGEMFDLTVHYVDNGSRDGSVAVVRPAFAEVVVHASRRNLGFAAGNNLAIVDAIAAGADYVFLANPDTCTPPSLIHNLVLFMEQWPNYGIVGPVQWEYPFPGAPASRELNDWSRDAAVAGERHGLAINRPTLRPHPSAQSRRAQRTLEHSYVQGAALFARAAMIHDIGMLDAIFHSFYEEAEWCRRARVAGWRVALLLDHGIQHCGGSGSGGGTYRRRQMMRNKFVFLLTDRSLDPTDMLAIAGGWIRCDVRGRGVGGTSSVPVAAVEVLATVVWLASRLPAIVRMRRRDRALARRNTRQASPSGTPETP